MLYGKCSHTQGKRCTYVGAAVSNHPYDARYPIQRGLVTDWDDMEALWRRCFKDDKLKANPTEHPVLLCEPACNPKANKEKTTEVTWNQNRHHHGVVSI